MNDRVLAEQVALLHRSSPVALAVSIATAIFVVYVHHPRVPLATSGVWFGALIAVTLARAGLLLAYDRSSRDRPRPAFWARMQVLGAAAGGVVWGSAALFLYVPGAVADQVFLAFVLGGVSAAAVAVYAPRMAASTAFLLPALLPLAGRFFMQEPDGAALALPMGVLTLVFLAMMLLVARTLNRALARSIWLRLDKQILAERLESEKAEADRTNTKLLAENVERRQAERRLGESEERFRQLADHLYATFFWVAKLDGSRVLYASPAYATIRGAPVECLYDNPNHWIEAIHPDDRELIEHVHDHLMAEGMFEAEYRVLRPDGGVRWVWSKAFLIPDRRGEPYRMGGVVHDVTERHDADESLQELNAALSSAVEGIARLDPEGRYVYVNEPYADMLGKTAEEVAGTRWEDTVLPEDRPEVEAAYRRMQSEGRSEAEVRGVRKDGSTFWKYLVMVRASGRGGGHFCSAKDVTARRQAEEQVRILQGELAQIGRASLASEMAAGLAHELNQPLTAVASYAEACVELVQSQGGRPEDLVPLLRKIASQGVRAGEIIRRLRGLVRRSAPRREPVDLNELVTEVMELVRLDAMRQLVQVEKDLHPAPLRVIADAMQIQQVILSLARNAMEAMQELPPGERRLRVRTGAAGGTVELGLEDSGPGLAPEVRQRLFEPFVSTKPSGMGLSLSIGRSIVGDHGGRLWAEHGAGTTFRLSLPVAREDRQDARRARMA